MQRLTSTLSLAAFAGFLLVHCSTNDTTDGGPSTVVSDIGDCPTTADASAGKFPHAALPTGQTCAMATSCHMAIDDCPNDFATNPPGNGLNEYDCLCADGGWSCVLAVQVDDECGDAAVASLDAGVDSAEDAPGDAPIDSDVDATADAASDANLDAGADATDGSPDASGDAAVD